MSAAAKQLREKLIRDLEIAGAKLPRHEWRELIETLADDMKSRIECMDDEDGDDE